MATRDELYAKFGITAEAAQLFETELGTLLLCSRGIENGWHILPDRDQAQSVLVSVLKVLESKESFMIQGRLPDSKGAFNVDGGKPQTLQS